MDDQSIELLIVSFVFLVMSLIEFFHLGSKTGILLGFGTLVIADIALANFLIETVPGHYQNLIPYWFS